VTETIVCDTYAFNLSHFLEDYVFFISPAMNSRPHLCSFYSSVNKYHLT